MSALSIVSATHATEMESVAMERNVEMKIRHGVLSRADVYRPSREGKYPVLLYCTPYDKFGVVPFGLGGASQGYIVISEDVRGRYG
jgi:predicted acyl esterase